MTEPTTKSLTGPLKAVLVTGPSGAGRSTAIRALEDLGFEAIDNLPLSLVPRLLSGPEMTRHLALGMDVRNRDFSAQGLIDTVDAINLKTALECTLIYLDCDPEILLRRYSETRRRHPLAPDETPQQGIRRENNLLTALRDRADVLIDTTEMSPHDLRAELAAWFGAEEGQGMAVSVQSFSYKRGIPRGVDMVLDCRFLRNPHWQKELRAMDGRNAKVAEYITADPRFADFIARSSQLVESLLPAYRDEGKSYFTLALGCTGGQHRSVFVAETMANTLAEKGWQVSSRHRELERRAEAAQFSQQDKDT